MTIPIMDGIEIPNGSICHLWEVKADGSRVGNIRINHKLRLSQYPVQLAPKALRLCSA